MHGIAQIQMYNQGLYSVYVNIILFLNVCQTNGSKRLSSSGNLIQ